MIDKVKSFLKGVMRRMFPAKNIKQALDIDTCVSDKMLEKIEFWGAMYRGEAPWCKKSVVSLRKEQGICREFSNVVLNEMESKVSSEVLDKIYKKAIRDLNENLQSGLAFGSFIIKVLGGDKVEYVTADRFVPVEFDGQGRLVDVVFVQIKKIADDDFYIRFERHSFEGRSKKLIITNTAFHSSSSDAIGKQISLADVDEWKDLPESVAYFGLSSPDFGYYRNPIKNEIDGSYCGVSIFDSAIEQLRKVDLQGARLDWEFESGERAINVDVTALQTQLDPITGLQREDVPHLDERLYKGLNISGDELYKEWSPEFRDANIINGLNAYLREVEFNVCLSYGDLSDVSEVDKTATEVKIAKKRKYNMVGAIQENLKDCLEDLVRALAFYNSMLNSKYDFICDFKDSILVDEESERQQDRQDVSMGVMSLAEYRAKWYNEDIETAKNNLPEQNQVMDDDVKVPISKNNSEGAEVQGKQLNGAQTQSLIAIMSQYSSGDLTEGQAINLIATAIGIEKDEARKILNGDVI